MEILYWYSSLEALVYLFSIPYGKRVVYSFGLIQSGILEKLDHFHCFMQYSISRNCIEEDFLKSKMVVKSRFAFL